MRSTCGSVYSTCGSVGSICGSVHATPYLWLNVNCLVVHQPDFSIYLLSQLRESAAPPLHRGSIYLFQFFKVQSLVVYLLR